MADCRHKEGLSYPMASGTDLEVLEELSSFSLYQDQKSHPNLMLSVRAYAPRFAQLCALSPVAGDIVGEETTGTERAQTRPAFPGLG
jgi:hypothetical protein